MAGQNLKRGRFLVNLVMERDKENNTPSNILPQHPPLEDVSKMSSIDEVPSAATHAALSRLDNNYYISPIRSEESDFDDSDADPNFELSPRNTEYKFVPLLPPNPNGSLSPSSTSSSSSSESNDSSDSDRDKVVPQSPIVAEINFQEPEVEKKVKKE
ncbi:uncharacterized protein LOC123310452 [Coccinella septempunctata]|uniref:uncharacterized protein LOC123310452 n=1 Tax=Coccinella septempunctata TaxID=41139 RepID=UPI001D06AA9E|nr:uncharacterized protein LOC123310452 [Coccinella septempunctata]